MRFKSPKEGKIAGNTNRKKLLKKMLSMKAEAKQIIPRRIGDIKLESKKVNCLADKHEDLSSIPRTHLKTMSVVSQTSLIGESQIDSISIKHMRLWGPFSLRPPHTASTFPTVSVSAVFKLSVDSAKMST